MMRYVLCYRRDVIVAGLATKMVGPFDRMEDANDWHTRHAADRDAFLSAIWTPNAGD